MIVWDNNKYGRQNENKITNGIFFMHRLELEQKAVLKVINVQHFSELQKDLYIQKHRSICNSRTC